MRVAILAGMTAAALAGSGAAAGSASAAVECNGGSITGIGSSLQKISQEVWKSGFETNVCPGGPTISYEPLGSGAGISEWNATGSRGSINTAKAFIGTDDGPSVEQIANINSVANGAEVAVIPVTQTAISIIANPPAGCEIEEITNSELESVFKGAFLTWNRLSTAEGSCNSPITRVVRKDGSGTSYQFKNYLAKSDKLGLPCTTGSNEGKAGWRELEAIVNSTTGAPNTTWPESCAAKTLSPIVRPAANGGGELVKTVDATAGSIGYAALPDAEANNAPVVLRLQNNGQAVAGATFANPAVGGVANCKEANYEVPINGRNQLGSTGLGVDWSKVFGAEPGIGGTKYPLCTLTYVLAFHGYHAAGFTFKQEVTTHDLLQGYIVGQGQADLAASNKFYAPLPTSEKKRFDILGAAQFAASKITN